MGKLFRFVGLAGLLVGLVAGFSPAQAQVRQVMKIEGPAVNGESKVAGHVNWIDVASFSQEVQHLIGSQPDTGYFSILKEVDRASVLLAFHAVSGTVFDKVTLESLARVGDDFVVDYRVELSYPRIILVRPELSGNVRQESLAFDGYTQVTYTYYYRRWSDGSVIQIVTRTVPGS